MAGWTGIVASLPLQDGEAMASRLPTHLHPVAGRPLVWHAVSALAAVHPSPGRLLVVAGTVLPEDVFHDIETDSPALPLQLDEVPGAIAESGSESVLLVAPSAVAAAADLGATLSAPAGTRLTTPAGEIAAVHLRRQDVDAALAGRLPDEPSPPAAPPGGAVVVRDRASLAQAARAVRDRLVTQLMAAGVTFVLPDSVFVDVDVRIGRDTIVYPGVVLEGQTTIGEETVIGPSCRVISSWIGSGVEMKGWNYIAHTSVRNRAILEPYVRRGFD